MHTLTKPTKAAMTAIAEKMAEQWEVKFRKITTDINCAIHGLTDVRDKPRPSGRGGCQLWLSEAVGEFLYSQSPRPKGRSLELKDNELG